MAFSVSTLLCSHTFASISVFHVILNIAVIEVPNMANEKKLVKTSSKGMKSSEEILSEFQMLRNEQRMLANKLSEMEMELNEHKYELTNL